MSRRTVLRELAFALLAGLTLTAGCTGASNAERDASGDDDADAGSDDEDSCLDWRSAQLAAVHAKEAGPLPESTCIYPRADGRTEELWGGEPRDDGLCRQYVNSRAYTHPAPGVVCESDRLDCDGDGLSDRTELLYRDDYNYASPRETPFSPTLFFDADTDGDGISDGDEVENSTDALDPGDPNPQTSDPAFDGRVLSVVTIVHPHSRLDRFAPGGGNDSASYPPTFSQENQLRGVMSALWAFFPRTNQHPAWYYPAISRWPVGLIVEFAEMPGITDRGGRFIPGASSQVRLRLHGVDIAGPPAVSQAEVSEAFETRSNGEGVYSARAPSGDDNELAAVVYVTHDGISRVRARREHVSITVNLPLLAEALDFALVDGLAEVFPEPFPVNLYDVNLIGSLEVQTADSAPEGQFGMRSPENSPLHLSAAIRVEDVMNVLNRLADWCITSESLSNGPLYSMSEIAYPEAETDALARWIECDYSESPEDLSATTPNSNPACGGLHHIQSPNFKDCYPEYHAFMTLCPRPRPHSRWASTTPYPQVDTDGDGVLDAFSIVLELELAGAANTTFAPEGEPE